MYNLVNIHELEQFLGTFEPTQFLIVDIPDLGSPTGYTSYKVAPTFLQGINRFDLLEDTPNSYIGEGGKSVVVNTLESGLEFIDNKIYDSGWVDMPVFNGSYGLAGNGPANYRPKIRVIGNVLYMEGNLQLPEPTVAGGTVLDTNGAGYVLQGKMFSDLYTGLGDGYIISSKQEFRTRSKVLPEALQPTQVIRILSNSLITKTKNISGGRMRLSSFVGLFSILPDGTFFGTSIEATERNGDTGTGWNKQMHMRKLVDRFNTTDELMNYDNYRNSNDNLSIDQRVQNIEGYNFEYNFDGSKSSDMGGFFLQIHTSYPLNENLTKDQIKTAIDSL
jgi:hypothetical protein